MNAAEKKYQGTVLKVDDTPCCIDLIAMGLSRKGLKVLNTFNSNKGIQIAEQAQPDVILLNFMSDMNSFEVYQVLKSKETTQNIPVIFMFSMKSIESELIPKEILEMEYVTKPFRMKEVWEHVKKYLKPI
jgi:DNA-binding response OmpR family regulator